MEKNYPRVPGNSIPFLPFSLTQFGSKAVLCYKLQGDTYSQEFGNNDCFLGLFFFSQSRSSSYFLSLFYTSILMSSGNSNMMSVD